MIEFLNVHIKWLIAFCMRNKVPLSIVFGLGMLAGAYLWSQLPAPYNPRYLFNLVTRTPVYVCKDGVYSWSASKSGACSSHGGVWRNYASE